MVCFWLGAVFNALISEPLNSQIGSICSKYKATQGEVHKIDFVEEKDLIVEGIAEEPIKEVPIKKPEIIKDEIEQAPEPKIELEPSRELEEHCN